MRSRVKLMIVKLVSALFFSMIITETINNQVTLSSTTTGRRRLKQCLFALWRYSASTQKTTIFALIFEIHFGNHHQRQREGKRERVFKGEMRQLGIGERGQEKRESGQ